VFRVLVPTEPKPCQAPAEVELGRGSLTRLFTLGFLLTARMSLRERTRPGLGIIEPCLPSPAKAPPGGPGWIHEIKHDGMRIMARRDGAGVRLITRHGNDFTLFVVTAVTALPARSLLIIGEAIVTNGDGLTVFDLIRHKHHGDSAVLCAFDLIELDGEGFAPLLDRVSQAQASW